MVPDLYMSLYINVPQYEELFLFLKTRNCMSIGDALVDGLYMRPINVMAFKGLLLSLILIIEFLNQKISQGV